MNQTNVGQMPTSSSELYNMQQVTTFSKLHYSHLQINKNINKFIIRDTTTTLALNKILYFNEPSPVPGTR